MRFVICFNLSYHLRRVPGNALISQYSIITFAHIFFVDRGRCTLLTFFLFEKLENNTDKKGFISFFSGIVYRMLCGRFIFAFTVLQFIKKKRKL